MSNSNLFLAARFLIQGSKKITSLSIFALLAIATGVWALGSLISVMYGFESTLKLRVLKAHPHLLVRAKEGYIKTEKPEQWLDEIGIKEQIERSYAYFEGEMIARSSFRSLGVVVRGIPWNEFEKQAEGKSLKSGALLGSELASRLGLSVGDHVKVISPFEKEGLMGLIPHWETYPVINTFTSGHYDFDLQYLFLPLEVAQDLFKKKGQISGYQFWLKDIDNLELMRQKLETRLPLDWELVTWRELNYALFRSLKLEQFAMLTILSFAIVMASLNMVIVLLMQVNHKKKQIGVLRALGASQKDIHKIFTMMGILIGGTGLLLGMLATFATLGAIRTFDFFKLPSIYYDRSIPVDFRWADMTIIYVICLLLVVASSWLPAAAAARWPPIETIRET